MRVGIVGPFNPAVISDYFNESNIPSINESATAVNTLVRELLEQGQEIKVYTQHTLSPQNYRTLKGKNVEVYLIPTGIVPHLLGYHQLVVGQFYLPKRMAKVIKTDIDDLDVLHAHWTYEYAKAASLLSDRIPVFDTVRDWCPYQLSIMKGRSRLDWLLKSITFHRVMADKNITFIANSNYTSNKIIEAYSGKEVPVMPNPIDKTWILDKKLNNPHHQIISIADGLLSKRKNIGTLLEAFTMYRLKFEDARLHLVGHYDKDSEVFKLWEKNGLLEGVELYGELPHGELPKLLDNMSCLVHPSLEETFGNILLEAMSRCVPCIGGDDAGAVPDVLGRGKYGLVCDIKNPEAIYEAMLKMNEDVIAQQIQSEATKMLKEKYSSDIVVMKHIELFKKSRKITS